MLRSFLLVSVLLVTLPGSALAEVGAPIIAVFNIETRGAVLAPGVIDNLSEYLATRLTESGKYQAIPRDTLKARLVEQKRASYQQCYDQSCQIELGREMAAQKTLATRVAKLGGRCTVSMNVYDLAKAASEAAATASGPCSEEGIVASLEQALARLVGGALPPAPERAPAPEVTAKASPTGYRVGYDEPFWRIHASEFGASGKRR